MIDVLFAYPSIPNQLLLIVDPDIFVSISPDKAIPLESLLSKVESFISTKDCGLVELVCFLKISIPVLLKLICEPLTETSNVPTS